ncbi:toprim domain-containing protein [Gemmata sp. JC673]|uniref:Toprim domain-containing protein n=1 Tax=Gemmata algarum TaxID=2975278 RepID=A0ABU5EZ46_9BACT|nr:toprim domain-containing protein [Gemmata algarum]MDY3560224.1 toprim domain-containing protein [Gemmata algarum]
MSDTRGDERREQLTAVTGARPCPVCAGDHKCAVGDGGLILCGRCEGPVLGFRHLGPSKGDPQFHVYRRDEAPVPVAAPKGRPPRAWGEVARACATAFGPDARAELAGRLALPPQVFDHLPLVGVSGRGSAGRTFTFPECAADGTIIGLSTRAPDPAGTDVKKMLPGSKRGLTVPVGWRERAGPVLLVEGASDTLALTAAGLPAVGRPSNTGGGAHLAALLRDLPTDRPVLVVGENDRKDDGSWPGREGAERIAAGLRDALGRTVPVAMTPDGAKDVRQWLIERVKAGAEWDEAGRELVEALTAESKQPLPDERPEILVTTEEHAVNDAAAAALAGAEGVYQRGGQLVRVLRLDEPDADGAAVRVPAGATVIRELSPPLLREQFTRSADWFRMAPAGEGEFERVPAHPPGWAVQAVYSRGFWPGVSRLEAVVTHPVLLPDGSLLANNGYHRPTGVLVCLPNRMRLSVPERPSRSDATTAVELLVDAVCDFPFERPEHRGAWLAGLLTPLAWFAFDGPAPFFLIDGNVRGIGKGLLADTVALPVLGRRFSAMSYTPDREELRKRITSVATGGERMVLLDNLAGPIGNDQLDAMLTADRWQDRLLGGNRVYDGPLNVVWYGTGNNCELRADTSRRTCHIRLESTDERPEDRAGFKYPRLRAHLRGRRDEYLSAALTVLRGWVVAGRPAAGLPPWGSYESWSEVVRAAVVWAGLADPGLTRVALQTAADRNALAMGLLLQCLARRDPDRQGLTTAEILEASRDDHELRTAVEDLAGRLDVRALGYTLRSFARRNFENRFLDRVASTGRGARWAVYPMTEFHVRRSASSPSPPSSPDVADDGGDGDDGSERGAVSGTLFDVARTGLPD